MSFILLGILNSQAAAAGAEPAYELLETQVLSSTTSSVTFTNISQDYKHLQLRYLGRLSTSGDYQNFRFNGDTGTNYDSHNLVGRSSTAFSSAYTNQSSIRYLSPVASDSNEFNIGTMDILDYTAAKNKTIRLVNGKDTSAYYADAYVSIGSGQWRNTSAITSITIFAPNLTTGSRYSLYGIRG